MKDKLYKNKYFIAFYDKDDSLRYVFDNAHEIAEFADKDEKSVRSTISRILSKKCTKMIINGEKYTVHLFKD